MSKPLISMKLIHAAALTFALSACSPLVSKTDYLAGTTWKSEWSKTDWGTTQTTLQFKNNNQLVSSVKSKENKGTYTETSLYSLTDGKLSLLNSDGSKITSTAISSSDNETLLLKEGSQVFQFKKTR